MLRTMDWRVPIGVLLYEGDKHTAAQAAELGALLAAHNYSFVRRMGSRRRNSLWVGKELRAAMPAAIAREQRLGEVCVRSPKLCDLYK